MVFLQFLHELDIALISALNGMAGVSEIRDRTVALIANNHMFKGIPVFMIWWAVWARRSTTAADRLSLVAVILCSELAIVVGRAAAMILPFRDRPLTSAHYDAQIPIGIDRLAPEEWSSMPSDHALLFVSIAVGIYLTSRLAGAVLLVHALTVVAIPRIYLGFHFPSDILAGAAIGAVVALLAVPLLRRALAAIGVMRLEEVYPQLFYPIVFFLTFQSASLFDSFRAFAASILSGLGKIF